AVERHVLRLEWCDAIPGLGQQPAECRGDQALAHVAGGPEHHQGGRARQLGRTVHRGGSEVITSVSEFKSRSFSAGVRSPILKWPCVATSLSCPVRSEPT